MHMSFNQCKWTLILIYAFAKYDMHNDLSGWVLWCVRRWGGLPTYVYIKAGSNPWPDAENWSDNITRVRQARQGKEETGQARAAACWHARATQSLLNLMIDKPHAGKNLALSVTSMIQVHVYGCCFTISQFKSNNGINLGFKTIRLILESRLIYRRLSLLLRCLLQNSCRAGNGRDSERDGYIWNEPDPPIPIEITGWLIWKSYT